MNNYAASPLSRNDIRTITNIIREIIDLTTKPYFPIIQFLEFFLPNALTGFNYEIVAKMEMPEKHGETFPSQKLIRLREDIYLGADKGNGRDRFTIAHEIGHLFLHQKDTISLPRLTPHNKIKRYENPEWQADAFAGELLMPAHLINGMSISEVQKQCGVSAKAAQYQLNSLKRAN